MVTLPTEHNLVMVELVAELLVRQWPTAPSFTTELQELELLKVQGIQMGQVHKRIKISLVAEVEDTLVEELEVIVQVAVVVLVTLVV